MSSVQIGQNAFCLHYLIIFQCQAQLQLARDLYGATNNEWQQFVATAPGGATDLCGQLRLAIWEKVYSMI